MYPQILMTSIVLCLFSMGYLSYETFRFILSLTGQIKGAYSNVYDSVFTFLRNGLQRYFDTFKIQATTDSLQVYFDRLGTVEITLDQLIFAIKLGVIIGT